jgi:hypothetical protein
MVDPPLSELLPTVTLWLMRRVGTVYCCAGRRTPASMRTPTMTRIVARTGRSTLSGTHALRWLPKKMPGREPMAFGEPGVDRGEERDRLLLPALVAAQAGEAHGTAQFPGLRVLPARDGDTFLDGRLGLAHRPASASAGRCLTHSLTSPRGWPPGGRATTWASPRNSVKATCDRVIRQKSRVRFWMAAPTEARCRTMQ